jgi:hypothetical protein
MTRAWRAWVVLLSRRERGTSFALLRIAVAAVILYSLLSVGLHGLVPVLWIDAAHGGFARLGNSDLVPALLGGPTPTVVWTLYTVALVGAVGMLLGVGGRVPIVLVALSYTPVATSNPEAYGGYDLMISNAVWMLLLGNATATLSVDCRRRTGGWTSDVLVPAWPRYVLVFQLVAIYTSTGLHKLSADWVPGGTHAALYWVFQDPTWNRFDLRELSARFYVLTQIGTAATWWWEVTSAGLLLVYWYRYTADRPGRIRAAMGRFDLRKPWAVIGVSLHLGILVLLNVGPFSFISLAYYLCLWTPDEIERALARLRPDAGVRHKRIVPRADGGYE